MMTNCPSLLSTLHCVTRLSPTSIKYPIETVGKVYIENTTTQDCANCYCYLKTFDNGPNESISCQRIIVLSCDEYLDRSY